MKKDERERKEENRTQISGGELTLCGCMDNCWEEQLKTISMCQGRAAPIKIAEGADGYTITDNDQNYIVSDNEKYEILKKRPIQATSYILRYHLPYQQTAQNFPPNLTRSRRNMPRLSPTMWIPSALTLIYSGDTDTGVKVTVEGKAVTATVEYYTVTFKGWYTEENGKGSKVDVDTTVKTTSAHTLHAY